jgi:hypothetical protein
MDHFGISNVSDFMAQANRAQYLRVSLAQALRKEHFGRLCKDEPSDWTHLSSILSQGMTWSMVLALVVWLLVRVELTLWQAIGVVGGFLLLLALFAAATKRFGVAASFIVLLWVGTGVQSLVVAGLVGLLVTNILPFAVVALAVWTWRVLVLASAVPLLLPVALVVVFLPLLTQDLWILGDEIGIQLVSVAAVALAPPLLFLALRYRRTEVEAQFSTALQRLVVSGAIRDELLVAIKSAPRETVEEPPSDDWMWGQLKGAYEGPNRAEELTLIANQIRGPFRRQCIYRLFRLAAGAATLSGVFVFVLAWAAIPVSTSARWIGHSVDMTTVSFASISFELPVAPYVSVAALLAVVATAALVAFALTEDQYSEALGEVLVSRPAERCVLLGLAFRSL